MKVHLRIVTLAVIMALGCGLAAAAGGSSSDQKRDLQVIADLKSPSTYLWADKVVYRIGETLTLRLTQSPNSNPFPYTYFVYRENLQTGEKLYHPNYTPGVVTDMFGLPVGGFPVYGVPNLTDFVLFGNGGYLGPAQPVPSTAGTYRWVMELRDSSGTEVVSQGYAPFTVVEGIDTLSGSITTDTTLSNKRAYVLSGMVFVQAPATLTIEPGTVLFGETTTQGGLCIVPGAKIHAVGTPNRPVVFTSASAVGERLPGDWFGIALAGKARINVTGGAAQVEGIETVPYGGTDDEDDSGIMRYVRIEYAGIKFTPTREANGLYLCGVGSKTVLEYLHFNNNADDNIEFFGGDPNARYILCTGGLDDQLDWTEGFRGKVQFVITQVYPNTEGNRGIEADNWENGHDNLPRSAPQIYNMTILGPQQDFSEGEGKADHGLMLRRGTGGNLRNFIVMGYGRDAINMIDSATIAQANSGGLVFDNAILYNNGVFGANGQGTYGNADTKAWLEAKSTKIIQSDPMLIDPYHRLTPNYMPGMRSPATRIDVVVQPPDDGFFTPVNHIGGIGPGNNWLAGSWVYISEK
jgi:hypothetical protein